MTEETGLSWSCKADLPAIRAGAASVVHEGRIWVMGGDVADSGEGSASVITYGAETDTWEAAPPLPTPCIFHCAVAIDGGILLIHELKPMAFTHLGGWRAFVVAGAACKRPISCGSALLQLG